MARRRRGWSPRIAVVALSGSAAAGLGACGSPPIDDDLPILLPPRADVDASEAGDALVTAPDAPPSPLPIDAGADAFAAVQAALLCSAPSLALCFAFEGAVVDGSPNALKPAVSGVTFGPGRVGQAALFGPASFVRFAPAPAFEVTTATIEAWVKAASGQASDGVVFDDDNRMSLTILADGRVLCVPNAAPPTAKVVLDQWTHVACVFDGAQAHVYVDGAEVLTGAAGPIPSSPTSTAAVGGNAPSGEPFVGALDSLRVFHVARSPAQIAAAAGK